MTGSSQKKSRLFLVAAITFGAWLVSLAFQWVPSLAVVELKTLDSRFLAGTRPELADTSVVLVTADQNSLDFFARQRIGWPWPREFYGLLIDYLREGGARLIAFDIDFSTPDIDRMEVDGVESDRIFAEAIRNAGDVLLPVYLARLEEGDQKGDSVEHRHLLRGIPNKGSGPVYDRATAPMLEFQNAAASLGVSNFQSDQDDLARRAPLLYRFERTGLPGFGLACYALARNVPVDRIDSLARTIPTDENGMFFFRWYGRGGPSGVFKYYSIHSLILSSRKMKQGLPPDVPPSTFAGKYVIVGGSAAGLHDFKPTPFTTLEPYPGMEIHATMLSNLLKGHHLRSLSPVICSGVSLLFALVTTLIFLRSRRAAVAVASIAAIGMIYVLLTFVVLYRWDLWVPVVSPTVALFVSFAVSAVVSYSTEGRQKRKLRRAFNRYLSPHVVTEILEHSDDLELGGKLIEGTVFFSDIKNFTNISEKETPKDLVAFLNEYFSLASECILKNEAMLDKYIGDAVMAIFGAPIPRPDHAKVACLTALEVQRVLSEHYAGNPDLRGAIVETRMGLHSGRMIVGNIGHTNRLDFTAIGDTVNLASRLEGVNKVFGTRIIISEDTYRQAREAIEARELDLLRVKGKQIPIRIYELLGERGSLSRLVEDKRKAFEEALSLYRARDITSGLKMFREILSMDPTDGPSRAYIERCEMMEKEELPEDWDGIFTLKTK